MARVQRMYDYRVEMLKKLARFPIGKFGVDLGADLKSIPDRYVNWHHTNYSQQDGCGYNKRYLKDIPESTPEITTVAVRNSTHKVSYIEKTYFYRYSKEVRYKYNELADSLRSIFGAGFVEEKDTSYYTDKGKTKIHELSMKMECSYFTLNVIYQVRNEGTRKTDYTIIEERLVPTPKKLKEGVYALRRSGSCAPYVQVSMQGENSIMLKGVKSPKELTPLYTEEYVRVGDDPWVYGYASGTSVFYLILYNNATFHFYSPNQKCWFELIQ